jgi:peptidoglycan/xylan/chitin deacetylase (PgdA/CDA1 family)
MREATKSAVVNHVGWLRRPQLLTSFIALCLLVTAFGIVMQSRAPSTLPGHLAVPAVKGAAIPLRAPLPPVDCTVRPCVALTFDDGPDRQVTPRILDTLRNYQARATFYVVGREVAGKEDILRRMYAEGHEIGNHSWSHQDFKSLHDQDIEREIASTQAVIAGAGVPAPVTFRPPYGAVDDRVRAHVSYPMVRWDVDTEDWLTKDPARVMTHLQQDVRPGSIILMHDRYDATASAVDAAIQALTQQYQLVTVSELLALSPGDQGQFFAR